MNINDVYMSDVDGYAIIIGVVGNVVVYKYINEFISIHTSLPIDLFKAFFPVKSSLEELYVGYLLEKL